MRPLTVIKRNLQGQETWRYRGQLLHQHANRVTLVAYFDREDADLHGMPLCKGDRFIETYYTDRWYNVFEIRAHDDNHLRGWYCNIALPASITGDVISYIDLALDLLVFPDGRQMVLDFEEFTALDISEAQRLCAMAALEQLQAHFMPLQSGTAELKPTIEAPGA